MSTSTSAVPTDVPAPTASPRRPWGYLAGALILLVVAFLLWGRPHPAEAAAAAPTVSADSTGVNLTADAPQWQYVKVASAQEGPALAPLPVPGRVELDERRTASIGSPLAGRVHEVAVRRGDAVKQGQRLFSVRSRDFAELDRDLGSAREEATLKARLRDRAEELFKLNAIPEKDLLAARADQKVAELAVRAAETKRSSLAVSAQDDSLFWVTAPRSGTVVSLDVVASQEVGPERDAALVRLSDLDEVLVLADVPERDAADLQVGAEVHLHGRGGGLDRVGVVQHVSELVDPQRQTVEVRIRAQNPERALKPNAFVDVVLPAPGGPKRVHVEETAVVTEGEKSLVFVVKSPTRLEPVEVVAGRRREGMVELLSGLAPGTRYVNKGALLLLNQVDLAD